MRARYGFHIVKLIACIGLQHIRDKSTYVVIPMMLMTQISNGEFIKKATSALKLRDIGHGFLLRNAQNRRSELFTQSESLP